MEYWNLYDYEGKKKKKIAIRGTKLNDDDFHLVVNVWIMNDKKEFLITQRSINKSHPLMWECTGGSALIGETSKEAAIRETREELGIDISKSKAKLIGRTRRYYEGCPDILDVWLFKTNVSIKDVTIQKEEINDVMWASPLKLRQLFLGGMFEANAMFNKIVNINNKEEIYYVGFNANNAICNERFLTGSITLNPNNEKGNIYYSRDVIKDKNSDEFKNKYKEFIVKTMSDIVNDNFDIIFLAFNKKINMLLSDQTRFNIIGESNYDILEKFNDKKYIRDLIKDRVPVIKTRWIDKKISYEEAKEITKSHKFVMQGRVGSGGNNTYYIDSLEKFDKYSNCCDNKYFLSKYISNIPVNITLVIGKYETIKLPISIQLIRQTDDKFKYVGADFIYARELEDKAINKIKYYSNIIGTRLKKMGYQGIVGIDYIVDNNDNVYFMEINPRFQSSSFIISKYLDKYCSTNLAELHYLAITNKCMGNNYLDKIDKSFVNCYLSKEYNEFKYAKKVMSGYYSKNKDSYFRKVFDYSILKDGPFEKRKKDK